MKLLVWDILFAIVLAVKRALKDALYSSAIGRNVLKNVHAYVAEQG